jgi:phenylacetate-CoA ligase
VTALATQDEVSARRARIRALTSELVARDHWSRGQLQKHRRERLGSVLRHAVERSPYYRDVLGPAAVGSGELAELPTLTKTTVMNEFDRIVTESRITLDRVERYLAAAQPGASLLDDYVAFATSGTTGERGVFVFDYEEFAMWVAACLRMFARAGVSPEMRLARIGAPSPLHITRQLFADLGAGRPDAPRLSVTTPVDEMVEALNDYRPEAIVTYASIASLLADEQLEGRLVIEPSVIAVGAEVLTPEIVERVRDAWGIEPVNVYASTEALVLASSSPRGGGLCISDDLVILEVVDADDRPVSAGAPGHRVLLTSLVNRVMPLIRYELSDSVVLADPAEAAGLPYGLIESVGGRTSDILMLPARAGGEVAVHPYVIHAPFVRLADVRQYQIVREQDGLLVRIVVRPASAPDVAERVRAAVVGGIEAAGALAPSVRVETVSSIAREPGHAAKLKFMTHR